MFQQYVISDDQYIINTDMSAQRKNVRTLIMTKKKY